MTDLSDALSILLGALLHASYQAFGHNTPPESSRHARVYSARRTLRPTTFHSERTGHRLSERLATASESTRMIIGRTSTKHPFFPSVVRDTWLCVLALLIFLLTTCHT